MKQRLEAPEPTCSHGTYSAEECSQCDAVLEDARNLQAINLMPACPHCGRHEDVEVNIDASWWLSQIHWSCGNCDGRTFSRFDLDIECPCCGEVDHVQQGSGEDQGGKEWKCALCDVEFNRGEDK
jgi:transposase-like protein